MTTTYKEIIRKVFLKLQPRTDGLTSLAIEEGINEAQKNIARVKDFDELMVLDTTNAFTVEGQKSYHIENDLKLVRPKDIYSVRYMDDANSRKLTYIPFRELDERIPYTDMVGTGRPKWYTLRGFNMEVFRIPDSNKPLYIMHSQWPAILTDPAETISFAQIDDVIVALASEIALATLEGGKVTDWSARAKQLLGIALNEEATRPDIFWVARPFSATELRVHGTYWLNPWVRSQPE